MKKYRVIMNNVDKVTDYVNLLKDVESIKEFEKETGLILKYYIFNNKYDFLEYTHLGVFPDNERLIKEYGIGRYPYDELMKTHLDNFDILVIDKTHLEKVKKLSN